MLLLRTRIRGHRRGVSTHYDLIKSIVLLCLLAMASMTANTLPQLQRMLDGTYDGSSASDMLFFRRRSSSGSRRTVRNTGGSSSSTQQQKQPRGSSTAAAAAASSASSASAADCWQHVPVAIRTSSKIPHVTNDTVLVQPTPTLSCGTLRRRHYWEYPKDRKRSLFLPLAREMAALQANCTWPVMSFPVDNDYGLGSHLYLWSQALCNAWDAGYRVETYNPAWLWRDETYCPSESETESPLLCYFPASEQQCPQDRRRFSSTRADTKTKTDAISWTNVSDPRDAKLRCPRLKDADKTVVADFRTAAAEYLFHQGLSQLVLREAERQMGLLFHDGRAPPNLIAVHMRWGDKFWEMDLAPATEYVAAVQQLVAEQEQQAAAAEQQKAATVQKRRMLQEKIGNNSTTPDTTTTTTPNIYLSCEDPAAVQAFIKAAPVHWNVFVDRTVAELDAFRPSKGNRASWTARHTRGRAGLVALGSLLVALESDWFVVTTASNWSRLWNALRVSVLNQYGRQHCEDDNMKKNCTAKSSTRMINLRPGEW